MSITNCIVNMNITSSYLLLKKSPNIILPVIASRIEELLISNSKVNNVVVVVIVIFLKW